MDYSKMSDQEINRLVARRFSETYLFNEEGNPYQLIPDSMAAYSGSDFDEVEFQPCGNPADAWPIIVGNKISIRPHGKNKWYCHKNTGMTITQRSETSNQMECQHENPLRAAMIVFLKMQESANVPANPPGTDLL
ncbi:phage protein NinX family protein [Lelliottia amnigena]|uniref:phage protein NinX family protein n=1 Tax=Lelliottia amnigena TaxID=61646 RepID=UPI003BA39AE7